MRAALAALLIVLVAACRPAPDPRGVAADETLLQVSATGRAEARPDEARFTAGVTTIAPTAVAAAAGNAAAMTRVLAAAERFGVGADDLQTRSIRLARIDYGRDRGRFSAENIVEVRVRDVARASAALAAAVEAGANLLSGPDLRVADSERARRAAYAAAYRAARARADAYAEAAGLRVARVLVIRDGEAVYAPYESYAGHDAMGVAPQAVAAPPLRLGVTEGEVRVRADFALAPR